MNNKIRQAFSPLHASEQTLEEVLRMTDNRKKAVPKLRWVISAVAALICVSTVTVFAADYVINHREIFFFDSKEALAKQYTADNPGYAAAVTVPNSAEENEDMETAAEHVALRMEYGAYNDVLVLSDETDDLPETPWERRKVRSSYYPEYGIIKSEYLTGESYADTLVIEDFLEWNLSSLSQWLTPVEDGQIVTVSRKPIFGKIVMVRALLGYTTAEGKRFNLQYDYDEAARRWSGNEYVLNSAYDYAAIYVTKDDVETLIEEYDGQIWARAVNGSKSISIYTTGCTVSEMEEILESLNLSYVIG